MPVRELQQTAVLLSQFLQNKAGNALQASQEVSFTYVRKILLDSVSKTY